MNANLQRCVLISLSAIVICGQAALAQTQQQDEERTRREGVERTDAAARAQGMEQTRQQQERSRQEELRRSSESNSSTGGAYTPAPSGGSSAGTGPGGTDYRALGKELLRLPPLPVERNVLLGSWRVEGGGQQSGVLEFGLTGRGATPGIGRDDGILEEYRNRTADLRHDIFGRGVTFTPTTFSSGGAAGMVGGPVAYRSRKKGVIVAIPGDSRANPMFFKIVGPDRIESVNIPCALVRVGAPAANAAANATTAPGSARAGAAGPSARAVHSQPPAAPVASAACVSELTSAAPKPR